MRGESSSIRGAESSRDQNFGTTAPQLNLPKGGGAIRGIGEKFGANPVTGTGSMSVPIAISPGRSGFGPQLSLSYDSGAGNGPFGLGWSLSPPSITRKTDKGLPRYLDGDESDVFILSGAEDLVPVLSQNEQGKWEQENLPARSVNGILYQVRRYRPRIEGLFARIERWTNTRNSTDVFWRSISKDNITTWYGKTSDSRIADPFDASRIFQWLICQSHDDKGNVIVYGYKAEDSKQVLLDVLGKVLVKAHESNRTADSRSAQRYLKRIRYGNRSPYFPVLKDSTAWPEPRDAAAADGSDAWLFEAVLDYGEHDSKAPMPSEPGEWSVRADPFSSYRAGFEVRTYRTCQRILMFHHFPGEAGVERNCLVRSTDFTYSGETDPTDVQNPVYTFLRSVTQVGYRRNGAGYDSSSLPPVEFEYTEPIVRDFLEEVDSASLANLPVGLDGSTYRWMDLHGEGIPGILTEQGGAWYYKRNVSPISADLAGSQTRLQAQFTPIESVALKPNAALSRGAEIMDLAGDGLPDLVIWDSPTPGFYEHDEAEGWMAFRPLVANLNRNLRDPNLKFVDLDGDGHADVLISEEEAFVWHPSLGEEGFGQAVRVSRAMDEEKGPRVVFADVTQSIYLADLSGDGLTDIVRVRNGEVCYWPNLGYGRFGAKVTMDNSPCFDHSDQFDQKRIRLADIDGSGTTDILYLHRDGVRLYFNQSGNSWSGPHQLSVFPRIDELANIMAVDLLGNGTACLVWSSKLPGDAGRPMRYVNLIGDQKPHLLVRTVNNLGAETHIEYAPSTKFYLQDRRDGTPWMSRLPFPVHVVEKVTTYDHIGRNRFVTRYAYHHGYFDGEEREFRGFGMVEQWDTEEFATFPTGDAPAGNLTAASHVPPIHTKSWFHTGQYLGGDRVSQYFSGLLNATDRGEYFREPGLTDDEARDLLLSDTRLPDGLTPEEEREACRALKGSMLRQEVYADDARPGDSAVQMERTQTPYTVTEQNFTIKTVQHRGSNRHAAFFTHPCEAISYHYERNPADPRIQHALTLEVDAFGNVLKQATIGYGRRRSIVMVDGRGNVQRVPNRGLALLDAADQMKQTTPLVSYTESSVTNAIDLPQFPDAHRTPLPSEVVTFELTNYLATGAAGRFQASDLVEPDSDANAGGRLRPKIKDHVPYEAESTANSCRRPIEHLRTLYRRDDLSGLLNLGELGSLGLAGETYKLAFTPGLLTQIYKRPRTGQPDEVLLPEPASVLSGEGGYVRSQTLKADGRFPIDDPDDHWWAPSGRAFFTTNERDPAPAELDEARRQFFLTRRYRDPFGQDTFVDFDSSNLMMSETRDALGNRVTAIVNDYRVLQPRLVRDPNSNQTEVAFDVLGMVVGTALMGKSTPALFEGDTLTGFSDQLTPNQMDAFFEASDPHAVAVDLTAGATTRIIYDLHRFLRSQQSHPDDPQKWKPACAATLARETHAADTLPPHGLRIQITFNYSDGFGREIQRKIQAEPGPLTEGGPTVSPRWVGSGWTIFNNKGKPVRQYEPFFSKGQRPDGTLVSDHGFEFGVTIGVSPVLFYDPAERVIAKLHPNHSYEKVVFGAWEQTTYDVNDTCAKRNLETGDPRSDPDLQGYVVEYFKTQPSTWQTWYAERIGTAMGSDEANSAERASAHADTPTTVYFDVLGRPFLTVARNRVTCTGHDLDGAEDACATRVELDLKGNQRAVLDERTLPVNYLPTGVLEQRVVIRYVHNMLANRICHKSMDAGSRWMLNDVAAKPIRSWDGRGHNFTTTYDSLRRPVAQTVRGTTSASDPRTLNRDILVEKLEYGEGLPNAEALNLRTRAYRHFDSAGSVTSARLDASGNPVEAYDFKGNLRCNTRRLVSDYRSLPDWQRNPQLDAEWLEGRTRYDALNRPTQLVAPHSNLTRAKRNVIQPVFNEANLLDRLDVWLERTTEPPGLLDPRSEVPSLAGVANIDYDAKGQRQRIDYKNGASTRYYYDPLTFRLIKLLTSRSAGAFPEDNPGASIAGWPGREVQNLNYIFDPAGNITHIHDDAQQSIYFRNKRVEPSSEYTYDALYRLIEARGREHLGQGNAPIPHSNDDASRVALWNGDAAGKFAPSDGNAMTTYTERYVYDRVGNFLQMKHRGDDPSHPGWTRRYTYVENSLIEAGKQSNRLTSTQVGNGVVFPPDTYMYDPHGNMLRMPHLGGGQPGPNMFWDFRDRLREIDLGGGGTTYYVYDASGERVRKVWEKASSLIEERIYLRGFEIFRKHSGPISASSATLERETLHVMDDRQRIASVETRKLDMAGNDRAPRQLIRYQIANHLGSALLELDDQAQIISYEEYAPYGSSTYQSVRSQTETAKRYRYTGKERDEESGFYYYGARYYSPWLGIWISPEPRGVDVELNAYRFCSTSPVVFRDFDGNNPVPGVQIGGPAPGPAYQPWMDPPPSSAPAPAPAAPGPAVSPSGAPSTGIRPAAGIGLGPLLVGVAVFLVIMLTATNKSHQHVYTDPDTGKQITFKTYEAEDAYIARKEQEKRIAPGASDPSKVIEAPGRTNPGDSAKAPSGTDRGAAIAPGAPRPERAEAPGTRDKEEITFAGDKVGIRHSGDRVPYTIKGEKSEYASIIGTSVYVLKDKSGNVLYVGKGDVWERLRAHITDPKKTPWFGEIASVDVNSTGLTNSEALAEEQDLINQLKPKYNKDEKPYEKEFGSGRPYAQDLPKAQPRRSFTVEMGTK